MSRFAAFGALFLMNLATLGAAAAGDCERPAIEQLTHGSGPFLAGNDHPSASADGRYVAFTNDTATCHSPPAIGTRRTSTRR